MTARAEGSLDPIARFAEAARRYCAWAEGTPGDGASELRSALGLLLDLLRAAQDLPEVEPDEHEAARIPHAAWKRMHARFAAIAGPQYYATVDPDDDPGGDPVPGVGDLHDDLADVWRDLRPALDLHAAGAREAACWHWRWSYEHHWGAHAAEAVRILQARRP